MFKKVGQSQPRVVIMKVWSVNYTLVFNQRLLFIKGLVVFRQD